MASVAQLEQELSVAQQALKSGQITPTQYTQFSQNQAKLIAAARAQEAANQPAKVSPLPADPHSGAAKSVQTTTTGGNTTVWNETPKSVAPELSVYKYSTPDSGVKASDILNPMSTDRYQNLGGTSGGTDTLPAYSLDAARQTQKQMDTSENPLNPITYQSPERDIVLMELGVNPRDPAMAPAIADFWMEKTAYNQQVMLETWRDTALIVGGLAVAPFMAPVAAGAAFGIGLGATAGMNYYFTGNVGTPRELLVGGLGSVMFAGLGGAAVSGVTRGLGYVGLRTGSTAIGTAGQFMGSSVKDIGFTGLERAAGVGMRSLVWGGTGAAFGYGVSGGDTKTAMVSGLGAMFGTMAFEGGSYALSRVNTGKIWDNMLNFGKDDKGLPKPPNDGYTTTRVLSADNVNRFLPEPPSTGTGSKGFIPESLKATDLPLPTTSGKTPTISQITSANKLPMPPDTVTIFGDSKLPVPPSSSASNVATMNKITINQAVTAQNIPMPPNSVVPSGGSGLPVPPSGIGGNVATMPKITTPTTSVVNTPTLNAPKVSSVTPSMTNTVPSVNTPSVTTIKTPTIAAPKATTNANLWSVTDSVTKQNADIAAKIAGTYKAPATSGGVGTMTVDRITGIASDGSLMGAKSSYTPEVTKFTIPTTAAPKINTGAATAATVGVNLGTANLVAELRAADTTWSRSQLLGDIQANSGFKLTGASGTNSMPNMGNMEATSTRTLIDDTTLNVGVPSVSMSMGVPTGAMGIPEPSIPESDIPMASLWSRSSTGTPSLPAPDVPTLPAMGTPVGVWSRTGQGQDEVVNVMPNVGVNNVPRMNLTLTAPFFPIPSGGRGGAGFGSRSWRVTKTDIKISSAQQLMKGSGVSSGVHVSSSSTKRKSKGKAVRRKSKKNK